MFCFAAEMWFGILFAILVESVPMSVRSTTVGAFLFWMNNFGGNVPMFVEPVRKAYDYKTALAIFYAGFYLLSEFRRVDRQTNARTCRSNSFRHSEQKYSVVFTRRKTNFCSNCRHCPNRYVIFYNSLLIR